MKNPQVTYVSKSELFPAFGDANEIPPRIRIRKDLPDAVRKFVLAHENYHIKNWRKLTKEGKKYNWIWGEIKVGIYGTMKHPLGFFLCGIVSLRLYRLKFYLKRFKQGK